MDFKTESQLRAEINGVWSMLRQAEDDNKKLRRLLAIRVSGAMLYADDGELQCNKELPFIDFKRDSSAEIERKLIERGLNSIKKGRNCDAYPS